MKHETIYRKLADQVQEALNKTGLKPADLARELGVSSAYITQFLKHANKTPAERIEQMLDIMGYELQAVEKKTLQILVESRPRRLKRLNTSSMSMSTNAPQ